MSLLKQDTSEAPIPPLEQMKDILDIEGVYYHPWEVWLFWTAVLILAALMTWLLFKLFKWIRKKKEKSIPIDPFEEMKKILAKATAENFSSHEVELYYYDRWSELIRLCLEKIFPANFPEKTTDEIINHITQTKPFAEVFYNPFFEFLKNSDRVRFARQTLPSQQVLKDRESLQSIYQLLHEQLNIQNKKKEKGS